MADVFLSYKREDAARVRKLVAALREIGLDVWWDEDIPPSAPWEATIEKALRDAKAVVVCWTPASVASENVRSEARVAREDGRLIQVFLKPSAPPLFFGERQGVDLSKWRGKSDDPRILRIADSVRTVAAGERVQGQESRAPRLSERRRYLVIAAMLVLIATAGSLIAWRMLVPRPSPQVAVLPFEDLSPAHDKGYFAEGVAEEILSSLSTDKSIKVLGRTSARQIDRRADPKTLRRSLGITHLLEGSARTAGDALRIDVRLIDTRDGTAVWEDQYQGRLSDIFAVQDKVASAVVQHLRGMFAAAGATTARPVTQVNVYETYLAARAIMRNRTAPTLRQALGLARQVVASDPNYAPGHALYAELVWLLSDDPDSYGTIPAATASRLSEAHARTAIRLANNDADGYAALGINQKVDDQIAVPALRRAIVLDPSRADTRIWLAIRLTKACRYDEALQVAREAAAIEPLWLLPNWDLAVRLAVNGQMTEARELVKQYGSRNGKAAQYQRLLFAIEARGGDVSSAIAQGKKALALDASVPNVRGELMSLYYVIGREDLAPKEVPQIVRIATPFYRGDWPRLQTEITQSGAHLWQLADGNIGLFQLAAARDWTALNALYDQRPFGSKRLCFQNLEAAQAMIPALRAAGRRGDAEALLNCLRERLAIEEQQKSRSWYAYPGDYEYGQATFAALTGDNSAALNRLEQAIARGWLGRPYSTHLKDRPQFDALLSNPRLAALQAAIDRRIARERAEVLSRSES